METAPFSQLLAGTRALIAARRIPFLTALGLGVAVSLGLLLAFRALANGILPEMTSIDDIPSLVPVLLKVAVAWLLLVTALVLPVAFTSAALRSTDDAPTGWVSDAFASTPALWLRLALPLAPLLVLTLMLYQSLVSSLGSLAEGNLTAAPKEPIAAKVLEQLLGEPAGRWAFFLAATALWMIWTATHATDHHRATLPHKPWRLFGAGPIAVGTLIAATTVTAGLLVTGVMRELAGQSSAFASGEGAAAAGNLPLYLVFGALLAATLGAAQAPWRAAFDPELASASATATSTGDAAVDAATAAVAAAGPAAQPGIAASPVGSGPQVIEAAHDAVPGAPAGSWWYLRTGAAAVIETASHAGAATPQPVVADANGAWLTVEPGAHPAAATFVAPADGWYLLGGWLVEQTPQQIGVRLTLPADAHAAPTAA